jgi:hypothetical protein
VWGTRRSAILCARCRSVRCCGKRVREGPAGVRRVLLASPPAAFAALADASAAPAGVSTANYCALFLRFHGPTGQMP